MVRTGNRPLARAVSLTVSLQTPPSRALARAASVLRKGGLVAFPTDTLYALGADASNPLAISRIFAAKGRSPRSPLPLLIADLPMATRLVGELPEAGARLAERYWPGPLTLLVPAPHSVCSLLTAATGRIGLRVPDAALALALIRRFGGPVTGTSANRSGGDNPLDAQRVQQQIGDYVDLILDGGTVGVGSPSTVVDVTQCPPVIVRQGVVGEEEIFRVLGLQVPPKKKAGRFSG